jgi:sugar phosphate isomerase/epimerase
MFLPSPRFMTALKKGLSSNAIKFCFDIGHFSVYTEIPLEEWLDQLGDAIVEMHLNDNSGTDDEHLALGAGAIAFRELFQKLSERRIFPRLTLEMTSEKFEPSLAYLAENDLLALLRRR